MLHSLHAAQALRAVHEALTDAAVIDTKVAEAIDVPAADKAPVAVANEAVWTLYT